MGAFGAEYRQNVMKKFTRFITFSCLTLCRKCNNNLLFIQAASQTPPKWKYLILKRYLQQRQLWAKATLQILCKIGVLKNFAGKKSVLKSPFNKVKTLEPFLRTPCLKNTSRRLVLCGPYFLKIFYWRFALRQLLMLKTQGLQSKD